MVHTQIDQHHVPEYASVPKNRGHGRSPGSRCTGPVTDAAAWASGRLQQSVGAVQGGRTVDRWEDLRRLRPTAPKYVREKRITKRGSHPATMTPNGVPSGRRKDKQPKWKAVFTVPWILWDG